MKDTLIVAGGGTGGHVLAGIAIADQWVKVHGPNSKVIFVGAKGGLEEKLVPKSGYPLTLLSLGSLNRVSWQKKIKTVFQLPLAFAISVSVVLRSKPTAVIGVGGYASGPLLLAAVLAKFIFRIKTGVLEQNTVSGMTNRILFGFVDKVFLAFPSEIKNLKNKLIISGNPVRTELVPMAPPSGTGKFGIFIFGGSQGALGLNTKVIEALPYLEKIKTKIKILHQTGVLDYDRVNSAFQNLGFEVEIQKFVYDMKKAYSEASLILCRSGSSTLSELATVKRAAILVPLPTASDNHQEMNAKVFYDKGAAILFRQNKNSGKELAELIGKFLENPSELRQMEINVSQFHNPGAAQMIVENLNDKT